MNRDYWAPPGKPAPMPENFRQIVREASVCDGTCCPIDTDCIRREREADYAERAAGER